MRLRRHLTDLGRKILAGPGRSRIAGGLMAALTLSAGSRPAAGLKPGDLFLLTNVWTAHFSFTAEQWKAMEPANSGEGRRAFGPDGPQLQGRDGGRNGLSAARGIEFEDVSADLDFAGTRLTNIAVRYKGNGTFMHSQGTLKRSLKADLNDYVPDQRLAGASKLNFHNNVTDPSWMNETLAYRLYREAGVPAPRTAYAKVWVTVPGRHERRYFGLYSLVENVDHPFAEENFGTKKGALLKPVTKKLFDDLGDDWKKYNQSYDPKTTLTREQERRIIDFCKLVTRADDAEFAAKLGGFLDLDEFARFMAVTVYLSTLDSILGMGQNFLVHLHPKSNQFQFIPWDLDNSFGQFRMTGTQEEREQLSVNHPWQGENRFLERVFKVEAFQKLYRAKLEEFSRTLFKPERLQEQVDEVAAAIRSAVKEESAEKLARFDKVVAGESVETIRPGGGPGRGPGGPGGRDRFRPMGNTKPIKAFVTARSQSVADQLAGKSDGRIVARGFGPGGRGGRGGPDGPGGPGFGPPGFEGPPR